MRTKKTYSTTIGIYDAETMILLSEYGEHFTTHSALSAIRHAIRSAKKFIATDRRFALMAEHGLTALQLESLVKSGEIDLLKNRVFKAISCTP